MAIKVLLGTFALSSTFLPNHPSIMKNYLRRSGVALLLVISWCACQTDEPTTDWSLEEFYTPLTDQTPVDSLVLTLADEAFADREESIKDLADRLQLTLAAYPPFAFHLYSAELDEEDQFVGYLPGLASSSLSDSTRQWTFQSGRYLFRFQESEVHRFLSIAEKLSERRLVDARGERHTTAHDAAARLYVNDEQIIDHATGLKRERLTFTQPVNNLSGDYPGLSLPLEVVAVTDYRYDKVIDDSLDDGIINEKRARVLLVVHEEKERL